MNYTELVGLGYRLYPCIYGKKGMLPDYATKESIGGSPHEKFGSVMNNDGIIVSGETPTDEQYQHWFEKQSNIQAFCGKAGDLIALDFDCVLDKAYRLENESTEEYDFRCRVIDFYEGLDKSFEVRSASGKRHVHFSYSHDFPKSIQILPYLEIRSNGSFIMMPGSVFIDSNQRSTYQWITPPKYGLKRPELPTEAIKTLLDDYYTTFPNTERAKQTAKAYENILGLGKGEKIKDGRRVALLSEVARLSTFGLRPDEIEASVYGFIHLKFEHKEDYLPGGKKFADVSHIIKDVYAGRLGNPEKAAKYIAGRFEEFNKEIGEISEIKGILNKESYQQWKTNILSPKPVTPRTRYDWLYKRIGSFQLRRIYAYAAPSGAGKTRMSLNFAEDLCKNGKKVVYFMFEGEFEEHVYKREVYSISQGLLPEHEKWQDYNSFIDDEHTQQQKVAIQQAIDIYHQRYKHIDDMMRIDSQTTPSQNWSTDLVCNKIEALSKGGYNYVIIDHLQHLECDDANIRENHNKMKLNIKKLKLCAQKCSVCILLPCQMNMKAYNTSDELSEEMIAGSIETLNYADVLFALRPVGKAKIDTDSPSIHDGVIATPSLQTTEFSVLKKRYGDRDKEPFYVDFNLRTNTYKMIETINPKIPIEIVEKKPRKDYHK